jgi:predicted RNase H-like HicB family nuclease
MSMKFSVKVFKGEKYFIARVPELGITTQGRTEKEARRNLREAIQTHLEAMADYAIEHGQVAIDKGQLVRAS